MLRKSDDTHDANHCIPSRHLFFDARLDDINKINGFKARASQRCEPPMQLLLSNTEPKPTDKNGFIWIFSRSLDVHSSEQEKKNWIVFDAVKIRNGPRSECKSQKQKILFFIYHKNEAIF